MIDRGGLRSTNRARDRHCRLEKVSAVVVPGGRIGGMEDELKAVAEGLSARLGRSVAIDDPNIRLLAHTAHDEDIDQTRIRSLVERRGPEEVVSLLKDLHIAEATSPVRIPPRKDLKFLARVCVPIRCEGRLFGYLWLIDEGSSVTDAELVLASEAAAAMGQLMHRQQLLGSLRNSRDRDLLRDLISNQPTVREPAAAELVRLDVLPDGCPTVAVAIRVTSPHSDTTGAQAVTLDLALQRMVRNIVPASAISLSRSGGFGTVLIAGAYLPSHDMLRGHAELLIRTVEKNNQAAQVQVGLGPVLHGLAEAHRTVSGAEDVLRVASAVPGFAAIARYEELGIYRLLLHLSHDELPLEAVPEGLRHLLREDREGQLALTLETYLDLAGSAQAAAAALNLHRASLYQRIQRIEAITRMSLSDGGDRLSLHLGLKLARLLDITT